MKNAEKQMALVTELADSLGGEKHKENYEALKHLEQVGNAIKAKQNRLTREGGAMPQSANVDPVAPQGKAAQTAGEPNAGESTTKKSPTTKKAQAQT